MPTLAFTPQPSWTLRRDGALPRCRTPAPAALKLAFVFAFRLRVADPAPPGFSSSVALFAPLFSVLLLWLAFMLPAVFTQSRNPTAAACTLFTTMLLATAFNASIVVVLLVTPESALFTGTFLAAHLAWFSAKVHVDATVATHVLLHVMHAAVAVCLYCAYAWPKTATPMPDAAFLAVLWLPDALARLLDAVLSSVGGALLAHTSCWRLVGDKED